MKYVTSQEFKALEERVEKLEESKPLKRNVKRETSAREFLLSKKPKSHIETVLCLMYYLEEIKVDSGDGINSKIMKDTFKDAKEKQPANMSDVLAKCAKKGWIGSFDKKSGQTNKTEWKLTNTGITYVGTLGEN